MSTRQYHKRFLPLESDPDVFTALAHDLGMPETVVVEELLTMDESPDGRILAYILVFPTTDMYELNKLREDERADGECLEMGDLAFFPQTIDNACGLYALLHAVCNGRLRSLIRNDTFLFSLLEEEPKERTKFVEESKKLEDIYGRAASAGQSELPEDPDTEVDYHYTCFTTSTTHTTLFELDGDRRKPIQRGDLDDELNDFDLKAREAIQAYIDRESHDGAMQFNVLTVVEKNNDHLQ